VKDGEWNHDKPFNQNLPPVAWKALEATGGGGLLGSIGEKTMLTRLLLTVVLLIAGVVSPAKGQRPPRAEVVVPCRVVEVVDGDTLTVEVKLRARVRMKGCWAEELHSRYPEVRARAQQSKQHLKSLALNKDGLLRIDLAGVDRLDKVFSFGRIVGNIYLEHQAKTLAQRQIEAGYATATKLKP